MCRLLMAYSRITTEGWLGMRWVKVGDGRDNGGAVHTASNVMPRPKITIQLVSYGF